MSVSIRSRHLILAVLGMAALFWPCYVLAKDGNDSLILRHAVGGRGSEVVPGESKTFFVEVANDSSSSTSSIRFTSDAPKKWVVEFRPQSIGTLVAGSYQTVEVTILPPENAEKGDYSVTVIADSSVGRRAMGIYVRVEKGTSLWIWVGGALGVVAIAVFVIVFRRSVRD